MSTWPPTVADVQTDIGIGVEIDAVVLTTELAAAVAYVQDKRKRFNYSADPSSAYPAPTDDIWLGTIRLARRWHDRRRASAGIVYGGTDGAADSVPWSDPDIDRLLGLGKFVKGAFA